MAPKIYTLHKAERVKKRRYLDQLFQGGKSFAVYPFRVFYFFRHDAPEPDGTPDWAERVKEPALQVGVGAGKKHFKKAVDRNRIKRLAREALRLQKLPLQQALQQKEGLRLKLFVHYTGKELPTFAIVQQKVDDLLQRLLNEIEKVETTR